MRATLAINTAASLLECRKILHFEKTGKTKLLKKRIKKLPLGKPEFAPEQVNARQKLNLRQLHAAAIRRSATRQLPVLTIVLPTKLPHGAFQRGQLVATQLSAAMRKPGAATPSMGAVSKMRAPPMPAAPCTDQAASLRST
ncbi:MAG TPA: hypothetical protein PK808_09290 [Polymorphobacter sp.]|nr:hypothetical protein [Polymorphobacter sp.]